MKQPMTEVYMNGRYVGDVEDPAKFVESIIAARRKGEISKNVNLNYYQDKNEVQIENQRGRLRRPLLVVKEGKPLLLEKHLQQLEKGEITFAETLKVL